MQHSQQKGEIIMRTIQAIQRLNTLQQSLIWGTLIGVFSIIMNLIAPYTAGNPISHFAFSTFQMIIRIAFYVFIGFLAAQWTGKARTGALVGFFTGLISSIIVIVSTSINLATNPDWISPQIQEIASQWHLDASTTATLVLSLVFLMMIVMPPFMNAIPGAIGGAIGKHMSRGAGISEI